MPEVLPRNWHFLKPTCTSKLVPETGTSKRTSDTFRGTAKAYATAPAYIDNSRFLCCALAHSVLDFILTNHNLLRIEMLASARQPQSSEFRHYAETTHTGLLRGRPGKPIFSVRHPDGRLGTCTVHKRHCVSPTSSTEEDMCKRTQFAIAPRGIREIRASRRSEPGEG